MKKSVVVYNHVTFWIAALATKFIFPYLSARFLSVSEYSKIASYVTFFPLIFFYFGYFGILIRRWKRSYWLISILGMVPTFIILFLISKEAFLYAFPSIIMWTTVGCLFRFFIDWFKKRNEVIILEKENVSSNLALLKNQINPHFLFNTLHNIDTLIYENQGKASEYLAKLSDIMRYMLNGAKSDLVDLHKELEHLENYLELEQLRLKNEKFLNSSINGDVKGIKIAPMLMIPFVENAFKHSVDSNIEDGIKIMISIENHKLHFVCENRFDKAETDKDESHGIGLEILKKRLNLIYKNKYKLLINSDDSVFKVNMEIELNDN